MAVAFDAVGPSSSGASATASPLTWAHVNSAAGNAIVVGINWNTTGSPQASAVTYGGVSLSRLGSAAGGGLTSGGADMWGTVGSLPTGSNTVSVTFTGDGNHVTGGSMSFTGAVALGTAQTSQTGTTQSISYSFTGSTSGDMIAVVGSYGNGSGVFSTTSPGTQRWAVNGDSNGAANNTAGATYDSPGGSQSVGFSNTAAADQWGLVAVEILATAPPPSVQKFYLHDAATSNTGTLPSGENSASSPSVTATGATTQRAMDGTAGVSQTSIALTTLANTSAQPCLFRMFESARLAAQTIGSGNWQLSMAGSESNANSNLHFTACVYAWRPSTGAVVGSLVFDLAAGSTGEPSTTETAVSDTTISGGSVTVADQDILVCEIWRDSTVQGTATARTNTFFYDGTTDASSSSNAAYLLAPAAITLYVPPAFLPGLPLVVAQAVKRASFY